MKQKPKIILLMNTKVLYYRTENKLKGKRLLGRLYSGLMYASFLANGFFAMGAVTLLMNGAALTSAAVLSAGLIPAICATAAVTAFAISSYGNSKVSTEIKQNEQALTKAIHKEVAYEMEATKQAYKDYDKKQAQKAFVEEEDKTSSKNLTFEFNN